MINENLPKKYEGNFFSNLINKVKSFFYKNKESEKNVNAEMAKDTTDNVITEETSASQVYQEGTQSQSYINQTKSEVIEFKAETSENINPYEQKKFMDNLRKHPELLEKFSNDRLEVILEYYKAERQRLEIKLQKLQKSN